MNPNLEKEILKILSDSTYPLCLADLAKLMHYPEMEILPALMNLDKCHRLKRHIKPLENPNDNQSCYYSL
jgi:hypothetical protein